MENERAERVWRIADNDNLEKMLMCFRGQSF